MKLTRSMKRKEKILRLGRIVAYLVRKPEYDTHFLTTKNKNLSNEQINQHYRNHESINLLSR